MKEGASQLDFATVEYKSPMQSPTCPSLNHFTTGSQSVYLGITPL